MNFDLFRRWVAQPWQQCSRPCGGGKQKRKLVCMQQLSVNEDRLIRDKACSDAAKPDRVRPCNEAACKAEWHEGEWSEVRMLFLLLSLTWLLPLLSKLPPCFVPLPHSFF